MSPPGGANVGGDGGRPEVDAADVHATAIVVAGKGILIRGAARSGKSALALCALRRAEALGAAAALVADDRVLLVSQGRRIEARSPPALRGLIEISGVGIIEEPAAESARILLVVDLCEPSEIARLPEVFAVVLLGVRLRRIVLPARQAAFGADVLATLARAASLDAGDAPLS